MSQSLRRNLAVAIIPLLVVVALLQSRIDPTVRELNRGQKSGLVGLSNEFVLGPLLGMQQAVAGLLWVRADEFFHSGDYDAILPIVRMVTWLDPHQLDVYITGAWHLAYNFTDSNERSDRRYIPAAQKLLEEGDANNPQVYDIAFELGWQNTDKIKNYDRAAHWFEVCTRRKAADDTGRFNKPVPMFVWHQLAHALARQGRIDESVEVWKRSLAMTEDKLKANPKDFSLRNVRDSERHNLELTLKREFSRYTHQIDWELDKKSGATVDYATGVPSPRDIYIFLSSSDVARRAAAFRAAGEPVPPMAVGQPQPPAIDPKWDTAFNVRPEFIAPKVLMPHGQFNVGDGARVTIRLQDEGWREKQLKEFSFNVDQSQTIMQDQHSVRAATWGRKIDMSKDPKMYSFTSPAYFLIFEFNPRGTSPFIQDRFGWSGEGMTDKHYLWVDESVSPPMRVIRKIYRVTRNQVLGADPITEADVVPNAEYARIQGQKGESGS